MGKYMTYEVEQHTVVQTKSGHKVVAKCGYNPGVDLLCKMKDTGNGYIFKFPSYNSVQQENYICMDYDEAEYIWQILDEYFSKS